MRVGCECIPLVSKLLHKSDFPLSSTIMLQHPDILAHGLRPSFIQPWTSTPRLAQTTNSLKNHLHPSHQLSQHRFQTTLKNPTRKCYSALLSWSIESAHLTSVLTHISSHDTTSLREKQQNLALLLISSAAFRRPRVDLTDLMK